MGFWDDARRVVRSGIGSVPNPVKVVREIIEKPTTITDVAKEVIKAPNTIVEVATEGAKQAYDLGKQAIDALPDEIKEPLNNLLNTASEEISDAVDQALDELPPQMRGPLASMITQYFSYIMGNLQINDSLKFFDNIDRDLAWIADQAYKPTRQEAVQMYDGLYTIDNDISTDKYVVYVDSVNKRVLNGIRGTVVSDWKDLYSDIMIMSGKEQNDLQFKASYAKWKDVTNKYPMPEWTHRMSGHSLGGAQVYFLTMTQPTYPNDRISVFNAGVGTSSKYRDFLNAEKNNDPRLNNLHTYKILGDPISILSALGKVNATKKQHTNPFDNHSMSNFLNK